MEQVNWRTMKGQTVDYFEVQVVCPKCGGSTIHFGEPDTTEHCGLCGAAVRVDLTIRLAAPVADPWRKQAPLDQPHKVFTSAGWEWRVLKAYASPVGERTNQYARWLCAVKSPWTYDDFEWGDTYIRDIPGAVPGQRS